MRCWLLAFLFFACTAPLPSQTILYIDTDAQLPTTSETPALFDQVVVEVFPPGASKPCEGCVHEFTLDEEIVNGRHASLGISQKPHILGYRARVRLYRSANIGGCPSRPDNTIETVIWLPATEDDHVVASHVFLHTSDLARPRGTLETPADPEMGPVTKGHAGTWARGMRTWCPAPAKPGEVCVPGGAFWMGNARVPFDATSAVPSEEQRLVSLEPFYLDATEVTVQDFRASGGRADQWIGKFGDRTDFCTFAPSGNDTMPVNCVEYSEARKHCQSLGKDLPTEAELEYVGSGLRGSVYLWGSDVPDCADTIFGLSGVGFFQNYGSSSCLKGRPTAAGPKSVAREDHGRDQLKIGEGTIFDLAGNVQEYALDWFQPERSACWPSGTLHEPRCTDKTLAQTVVRGGGWPHEGQTSRAAVRGLMGDGYINAAVGFRCARKVNP